MSGLVTVSRGKLGTRGVDAENGYIPADIRYSKVANPVLDILYNNNLSRVGEVSFERDGEGIIQDRYGNWQFISSTSFSNLLEYSNRFDSAGTNWFDSFGRYAVQATNEVDPDAGTAATRIVLDATTTTGQIVMDKNSTLTGGEIYTFSGWVKVLTGTITAFEFQQSANSEVMSPAPTSSWQYITHTFSALGTNPVISFNMIGTIGATFAFYHFQLEVGSTANSYIATSGSQVTVVNNNPPQRQNENGYLIEGVKTNLITFSGDLSNTDWTVSGATLSTYSGEDPFALVDQNTQLTFSTSSTTTITKTATFTNGTSYAVSLFAKLIGGSVSTMTASIGGGASASFVPITSSWVRIDVTCTAGAANNLVLTIISPTQDAIVVLSGIQVEAGSKSSLIRTGDTVRAKPADSVSVPYKIGRPDEPWTIFFTTSGVSDGLNKYIFNNGLTGSNAFSCYYSTDTLYLNIGGTISNFSSTKNNEVCLSYDGTTIKQYLNGTYVTSATNTDTVSTIGSILTIGSDGTNALDAQLSGLRIYDFQLTDKEIAYISGEY